jgi:hypothetical protein
MVAYPASLRVRWFNAKSTDAADMSLESGWQDEQRNQTTDHDNVVAVFAQQVNKFQQDRPCCVNLIGRVITKGQRHRGLMTSSRIAAAASSPRPLV